MKKITLLALTTLIMMGCIGGEAVDEKQGAEIVIIDSCEYLRTFGAYTEVNLSHKGNCRFCKERRQKELEELITNLKRNSYGNN